MPLFGIRKLSQRTTPSLSSPDSFSLPAQPPAPSGSSSDDLPQRFDLGGAVGSVAKSPVGELTGLSGFADDASQGAASIFATAGRFPSRVAETPFSLGNTALKRVGVNVGQNPIGQALGVAGEVVNRIGNFIPAIINSGDAELFKAVGDLPDSTPITDELVRRLEKVPDRGILNSLTDFGEGTGGGLFGIGNRPKTVGEFKAELAKRGFFRDGTPKELLQALRTGKSTFDFGDKSINDNRLVDMAGRMALDPSNALFLVPGGALAKVGLAGVKEGSTAFKSLESIGRILPAEKLIEAGAVAKKLPRPLQAAEAIAKGDIQYSTMKGLGELLKGGGSALGRLSLATVKQAVNPANYFRAAEGTSGLGRLVSRARSFEKSSLALGATNIAVNRLSSVVNDSLGSNVPILKDIADFTSDVENDRPLSENSAWLLATAIAFPYGEVAGEIGTKVKAEKVRVVGRNEIDDLIRAAGGHEKLLTQAGGPEALQQFITHIDKQIVRERFGSKALNKIVGAKSVPDTTVRVDITGRLLQDLVDQARRDGTITGKDRLRMAQQWAKDQGGFGKKSIDFTPSWDRIIERWHEFRPAQDFMTPFFEGYAQQIQGLREGVLFTEQVDAALTQLQASAKDGIVPNEAIKTVLNRHPQLNMLDRYGYWERYALPDMPAPSLRSVQAKLRKQRQEAVPIQEYFADAIRHEQEAPGPLPDPTTLFEPRLAAIARLKMELKATTDQNGTILPDQLGRAQQLQRALETHLADESKVAWVARGEAEAKVGVDPVAGRQLQKRAAEALGAPEIPATVDAVGDQFKAWKKRLDYEVAKLNPSYRAEHAPTETIIAAVRPDDPEFITAVQARTDLGAWLHHDGPLSKLSGFYDSLFGKVHASDLYRDARQALYNEFIPEGAKAGQVDSWLAALGNRVTNSKVNILGLKLELWRGVHAVPASMLLEDAKATLPASVVAKLGDKGILNRFDRAGSRFYRSARQGVREGSKFSQVLDAFYRGQQNLPLSGTRRLVGRTVYPLFRFMLDPRWIALNAVEGSILGATKDGILTAKGPMSAGASAFLKAGEAMKEMQVIPDSGWLFGDRTAKMIGKSWTKRSLDTVEAALNQYGKDAPELAMLRQAIRREADRDLAAGTIDAATHQKRLAASNREIGEYINDFLYRTDKRGVKGAVQKTVDEALDDWAIDADESRVLTPLLAKVVERNVELWQDVKHLYIGDFDRSTAERVMNSYWLYWPISYQIKATKWLADVMLNGSFGHDNGALLAGKYALWHSQHEDRLKNDPQYAAMFSQNRTLWFMAQMLLPIGPEEIGVSASKMETLIGSGVQDQVNDWTGSRLQLFTLSKRADGFIPTVTWITDMGPLYTQELLSRAAKEPAFQALPFIGGSQPEPPEQAFASLNAAGAAQ